MESFEAWQVTKQFRLSHTEIGVLRDVSHRFACGELTTIQGASGAGKTTLLQVLGGLECPDGGEVRMDGTPIYAQGGKWLARMRNQRVGFVFQSYHLLPEFSALENVMLPAMIRGQAAAQRAEELLVHVGLKDRMEHRPSEMSGGEQQRVAIARALINDPELLLADEPTGNLDRKTGGEVLDLMLAIREGRRLTSVLVTHDAAIAAKGHHRMRLVDGTLCEIKD
jgi:putative ABC transport system ATP-binding protein/lipoprotein-releasing system ATP-binding protein